MSLGLAGLILRIPRVERTRKERKREKKTGIEPHMAGCWMFEADNKGTGREGTLPRKCKQKKRRDKLKTITPMKVRYEGTSIWSSCNLY